MIDRIRRLVAGELLKLRAQPFLKVCLVILVWITLSFEIALPQMRAQKETAWRTYNSVMLFAYGFQAGVKVATYVLLIFSSMVFAGEFDRGTIKNLLTRPVTRLEFFAAKCLTVTGLASFLFAFVFFVAAVYALSRGDFGPVWDDSSYIIQRSAAEIAGHARKAVLMSFLSFLAAGYLGVLISNLTESSGYAVAMALVVYLAGDLATGFLTDRGKEGVFLYYAPYALEKLRDLSEGTTTRWNPDIDARGLYAVVPLAYMAGFVPAAFGIFRSRNITA
jgi:ABC-type transport system involved in multi-copper enzyme maturation permease subunit